MQFRTGDRVRLRAKPNDPGTVITTASGRLKVMWRTYTCRWIDDEEVELDTRRKRTSTPKESERNG